VQDGAEQQLRLRLLRPLDRELTAAYTLRVTSHDDGSPPRSATLTVHVSVGDANDNIPVMEHEEYNITVDENLAIGTVLLNVKARDLDTG